MPKYEHGKLTYALSEESFLEGMKKGHFVTWKHKALLALLHYLALRRSEIVKLKREQFHDSKDKIYVDVGKRLKGSKETIMIPLDKHLPYMSEIIRVINSTGKNQNVFPYSDRTVYNIVKRVFNYPHHHRLSRITWLIRNFGILHARAWTGLSLQTLEYYAGIVQLEDASIKLKETLQKKVG